MRSYKRGKESGEEREVVPTVQPHTYLLKTSALLSSVGLNSQITLKDCSLLLQQPPLVANIVVPIHCRDFSLSRSNSLPLYSRNWHVFRDEGNKGQIMPGLDVA